LAHRPRPKKCYNARDDVRERREAITVFTAE